jgi:hypothetical protein
MFVLSMRSELNPKSIRKRFGNLHSETLSFHPITPIPSSLVVTLFIGSHSVSTCREFLAPSSTPISMDSTTAYLLTPIRPYLVFNGVVRFNHAEHAQQAVQ